MGFPAEFRKLLGRSRAAFLYVMGRQPMVSEVTGYDDDVWIVSYPRSGNTWTRFLIANLVANGQPVDWTNIERRVPDIYLNRDSALRGLPRPRYLKSHEAYRPNYRRVVLIVRDPRDVAVSYMHFLKKSNLLPDSTSPWAFIDTFLKGQIDPYGNWGENVGSWLGARRGTSDFVVAHYEDLLEDTPGQLLRIAQSLQIPADDTRLQHAIEQSRADRMRQLEKSQWTQHKYLKSSRQDVPFVRGAKSGGWQKELPPEAARRIEEAWGGLMTELGYLA